MKILFLSDTHGQHHQLTQLPGADLLIHAGDISWSGTGKEIVDFVDWFITLDYKYKIFIGGNHDFSLEGKKPNSIQQFLPENCFYLCNSGITIENINFWGVPFFFADDVSGNFQKMVYQIPSDTGVLITHCPPKGILDKSNSGNHLGSEELLTQVNRVKPLYHLFGHIHEAYGQYTEAEITFMNGSILNEAYVLTNSSLIFDI